MAWVANAAGARAARCRTLAMVIASALWAAVGREARAATEVFVSDNGADRIVILDAATAAPVDAVPVDDGPLRLAATADGRLVYVGHFGPLDEFMLEFDAPGDTVSVIDAASRQVVDRIPMPCDTEANCRPVDVALTPDDGTLLVTHRCAVTIVDTASRQVRATVPVHTDACGPPRPAREQRHAQLGGIAVDAAGRLAYAVSGITILRDNPANVVVDVQLAVTAIDIAAGTIVPRVIDIGRASRPGLSGVEREVVAFPAITLAADGASAYVSHPLLPELRQYDVGLQRLGEAIAIDPNLRLSGLAWTGGGDALYASVFEPPRATGECPIGETPCPTLLRIDPAAPGMVSVRVDVEPDLLGSTVAIAARSTRAWVGLTRGRGGFGFTRAGAVAVVDTSTDVTLAHTALEGTPGGFAFVTRFACVGDCNDDGVVRIDELLVGVNATLGLQDLSACPRFDDDASGDVTVAELIAAVNALLNGCVRAG
jgi:hypothetical protein